MMKKAVGRFLYAAAFGALLSSLACVSATAVAANATAALAPSGGLAFGNVKVGTTSSAKKATLTNNGPDSISVDPPAATGEFGVSAATCGASLGPGASCTISAVFKPTSTGAKAGTLDVSTSASTGGSLSIPLSGTGTRPGAKLSATSLSFGSWAVNATSTAMSLHLTNTGNATLNIATISASGDFEESNDCGSSLGAGDGCAISVTFKPTALGSRTGKLTVKDDASSGTQTASLSGAGIKSSVALDPSSLNFRIQRIQTTSITRSATLTNDGPASLTLSDISTGKGYSQTNTCGSSVSAGGSCTISVTFRPTQEGSYDGAVTIEDNAGTQHLALTGIGGFPAFSARLKSVRFSNQAVGTSSLPREVKVTNVGTDKLFIDQVSLDGDFTQTNTCEPYINPGISCTVSVTFSPTQEKLTKGTLTVRHELGVYKLSLRGTGIPAALSRGTQAPNPTGVGPNEPAGQRVLSGTLKLVGILGLLLLLGGGGFLWVTRSHYRRLPNAVPDAPRPEEAHEVDQALSLDDLLAGILEPEGLARHSVDRAESLTTAPATPSEGGETASARLSGDPAMSSRRRAPYDWETDPSGQLA